MKFVFINHARSISKENIWGAVSSVTPPLGLATLSAVLEQDGHEAEILDAAALGNSTDEIVSMVDPKADFVGLSATTPEISSIISIAAALRKRLPEIKIIFGGVHPTVFHEELVAQGDCDMVVRGEGENAVRVLAGGTPLGEIPNLTWRNSDGKVIVNQQSSDYVDMDKLPFPSYEKLPMDKYRSAFGAARKSPSIGMITSRGCPGKCTFCYSGMFGSKIRMMSPERVLEHILFLKNNYGIREVSFYDDTFTMNKKRIFELCDLLVKNRVNLSWSCFARVDAVTPELLNAMKKAGCHQVMYGFESPDEETLKTINKKFTPDKVLSAIRWTREAGLDVRGALMLGNPGETEQNLRQTIDYSKELGMQFVTYNITTPYPGTAMYDWAEKEDRLKHKDWDLYDLSHPVLELDTVSSDVVKQYYHKAYREFYRRPSYVLGRLLSIRSIDDFMINLKAFMGIVATALNKGRN
jgi:radical SAM superfamily enzyme YgiQ (UPF0313 family)